jgi:hypothetical protein
VKLNCRDPLNLRGFVRIFFNRVDYEIGFVSEKYNDKSPFPPSPHIGILLRRKGMDMIRTLKMSVIGSTSDHMTKVRTKTWIFINPVLGRRVLLQGVIALAPRDMLTRLTFS